jgi:ribosome-associated protein
MAAMDREEDPSEQELDYRPSKSSRKRDADALQELGVELAALPEKELEALDLPEKLAIAVRDLNRLPTHGAKLRQRQYIGKLMRNVDPEPLRAKLNAHKLRHDVEIRRFQKIERWRDRLIGEPEAMREFLEEFPGADAAALRRLVAAAAGERAAQRPPKSARELFAFLRQLLG